MTPHGVVPPVDPRTGVVSIGVPVFNTEVRVVTDRGTDAAPGEIGELMIAGPQIVPRYWRRPKETAASIRNRELRTGDVGFVDEAGWFYLVDRAKDMIIASGFKVWPREVEEVLYLHPAVREAAVVGIPDAYRGETIKAVVSLKPGHTATPEEITQFARSQMAAYKYPRVVEIVDDLPKTASGKIMRRLLKTGADGWESVAPASHASPLAESPVLSRRSCWPGLPSGALNTAAAAIPGLRRSTTGRSGAWSRISSSLSGDSSLSEVIAPTT
jgi:long-chain acyl-CoA synthetase